MSMRVFMGDYGSLWINMSVWVSMRGYGYENQATMKYLEVPMNSHRRSEIPIYTHRYL